MIDPEYPDPRLAPDKSWIEMDGVTPEVSAKIAEARAKGREALERGLAAALKARGNGPQDAAERPAAPAESPWTSGGSGDDLRAAAIEAGALAVRRAIVGSAPKTPSRLAQAAYDAMAPHIRRQVAEEAAQIAERVELSISEIFDRSPADYLTEAALRIRRIGAKP